METAAAGADEAARLYTGGFCSQHALTRRPRHTGDEHCPALYEGKQCFVPCNLCVYIKYLVTGQLNWHFTPLKSDEKKVG